MSRTIGSNLISEEENIAEDDTTYGIHLINGIKQGKQIYKLYLKKGLENGRYINQNGS